MTLAGVQIVLTQCCADASLVCLPTLISRIFRSSLHMMFRSFICQPTLQGAATLSAELLAAASTSTSPWSGTNMCSSVAFCVLPSSPELYG